MTRKLDIDVVNAYELFLRSISDSDWNERKRSIEEYLEKVFEPYSNHANAPSSLNSISINDDRIGWYLYLTEMYLYNPYSYETVQGSRVIPLLKRIGNDLEILNRVIGAENRISKIVLQERSNPDSGIFEILTALLYARNGWNYVEFIPETQDSKTPDIKINNGNLDWYIECKRLSKSSEYSLKEREKWLRMWKYLSEILVRYEYPYFFDINFHVELDSLPDEFMKTQLEGKLKFIVPPCTVISNDIWDVKVTNINFNVIKSHLKDQIVKVPSGQFDELISGRRNASRGITFVYKGKHVRHGQGKGINYYVEDVEYAAGCSWDCDSERVQERKARDIRRHLSEAVSQLPDGEKGIVHIGLETLDGWIVEEERYKRIVNTVQNFDTRGKKLYWIFCHLFQPYAPPETHWIYDETVYYFQLIDDKDEIGGSLKNIFLVTPDDGEIRNGVHWDPSR